MGETTGPRRWVRRVSAQVTQHASQPEPVTVSPAGDPWPDQEQRVTMSNRNTSAETGSPDRLAASRRQLIPGGLRRPPAGRAGGLPRDSAPSSDGAPDGRMVPAGMRRPPADPAGRPSRDIHRYDDESIPQVKSAPLSLVDVAGQGQDK